MTLNKEKTILHHNFVFYCRRRGRGKKRRVEEEADEGEEDPTVEPTPEPTTKKSKETLLKLTRLDPERDNALPTDWKFHITVPLRYLAVAGYIFPPPKSEKCSGVKVIQGGDEITQKTAETVEGQVSYEIEVTHFDVEVNLTRNFPFLYISEGRLK